MKKTRKILAMVCALCLTAVLAVGGTLAYLTSTDSVTNTFVVGNVAIVLDELDTDKTGTYGDKFVEGRDQANAYKLYPGKNYVKDPTITVAKKDDAYKHASDSENCWLFIEVNNGIADIEDKSNDGATTIAKQMENNGWKQITDQNGKTVYALDAAKSAGDKAVIFENFTIAGTVTNEQLAQYAEAKIVVTAYAVQNEGFATAQAAWDASFGAKA